MIGGQLDGDNRRLSDPRSDRVRGCLLGGAVGDALGYPIEFLQLTQILRHYGPDGLTGFAPQHVPDAPQCITDDTQMTLFTAEGLLRAAAGADPVPALRQAYLRWLDTQRNRAPGPNPDGWLMAQPFLYAARAPGNACMSGLNQQAREYLPPRPFGEPGPVNPGSKGCGTVMRSAPFGLIGVGPDAAFTTAARAAQLTHGHPTGYIAAGTFAALIDRVVGGVDLPTAVQQTIAQLADVPAAGETVQALAWAVEVSQKELTPVWVEQVGAGWVAEECLAVAVCCALYAARSGDVRGALLLSVNHSGDSDSTGAVAGNLLGAVHGAAALPQEWVSAVEGREVLIRIADDLVATFSTPGDPQHAQSQDDRGASEAPLRDRGSGASGASTLPRAAGSDDVVAVETGAWATESDQRTVAEAAVADVHISDVPFSESSPLPFTPSEDDLVWARDHPGQWKYFAHGAANGAAVKPSDVVGAVLADDKGGFTEVWWNPEFMPPESTRATLATAFEVAVWKFVQGDSTLGQFAEAFAGSEVILLSEDDPAGERWPLRASGDEWWLDVYTSPGRLPEGVDPRRRRTVLGRELIEQVCPRERVRVCFKSGTSPEPVIPGSDFVTAWRQLGEAEKTKSASGFDDNTHLGYLHRVMGSGGNHTASEQPSEPKPEPKLQTGDLSRLAAREVLHISDKTRTTVQILPEPGERDFAWARANPGEWKYYADPRVDNESLQRRNLIGGRRAGEDGGFAETWLNPDFVPTEAYSGWQFATEFEVVVWRLSFGFNTIGQFIDAFSRSEFILLLSADDLAQEQKWPLVRNRLGDLTLTIYSSAGKLPADTNPWLRRMVSGRDVLEQVCPLEDAWVLINVHASPYQELSGANLLRWWREWQAAESAQPTVNPSRE